MKLFWWQGRKTIKIHREGVDKRGVIRYNNRIKGAKPMKGGLPHVRQSLCYANVHVRELPLVLVVLRSLTFAFVC